MITLSFFIIFAYLILIGAFALGFDKVDTFKLKDIPPKTTFTVIVPFRNEAENLGNLLKSISKLAYPKHLFEVILVDDASTDISAKIIKNSKAYAQANLKLITNERRSNAPKKDAISLAVKNAKNDWIVTTDADCILPPYWLDSFDEFIQRTEAKCIVAPVTFHSTNSFLKRFQLLDFLSLQGATIGGFGIKKPFLCNGANFAYEKQLFNNLGGFNGNTTIASGDDVFFLEKVTKNHKDKLHYLKSEQALVTTKPESSWANLIEQRLRWASKTSAYSNWFGKITGGIVLLANSLFICLIVLMVLDLYSLKTFMYLFIIKFSIDFLLLFKTAHFYEQRDALLSFPFAALLYPFFSVYIVFLSLFKTYKWKGRSFKQ